MLRYFWKRRHRAVHAVKQTAGFALRGYRLLPIPLKARALIKDMVFAVCEKFIFHTSVYQSWSAQRRGMQRINAWLGNRDEKNYPRLAPPAAPTDAMWEALAAPRHPDPQVDVIVPVYKGYDETLACIYSVLANPVSTPHELIVINDGSPDKALSEKLRQLADKKFFTLLANEKNLGFVATVNRGMQLHEDRDAVLLNADTEIYGDWLDRLRAAAYAKPHVASVTPFSNNAEICSYPFFVRDNTMRLECDGATLDRLAAEANKALSVEIPTGVGFCMYIRRAALRAVGYFDVKRFGKGYGEENDFCLRAGAAGFKHLIAGDVYVRHWGGASFQDEKHTRVQNALRVLHTLYPHYGGEVSAFLAADPVKPLRRNLDNARLARLAGDKALLYISHNWGGGTERHMQDMAAELAREKVTAYALRPSLFAEAQVTLSDMQGTIVPNLEFGIGEESGALAETLLKLGIARLHVHHLISFEQSFMDYVMLLSGRLGIPYDFTVHDYFPICPRINLLNGKNLYCGEPDIAGCEQCVQQNFSYAGATPVWQWRYHYERFLQGAANIYVPNIDVKARLENYFPALSIRVRPHFEKAERNVPLPAPRKTDERLRVAIIGAIGPHKGSELVLACAKDAAKRKLPLEFIVVGTINGFMEPHQRPHLTVTGAYAESEVYTMLAAHGCHVALFPSVWPETYCYTLTIAQQAKLFPIAFDIGAQAERIRNWQWGELLDISLMHDPAAMNDALLALHIAPMPDGIAVKEARDLYASLWSDYYGNAA